MSKKSTDLTPTHYSPVIDWWVILIVAVCVLGLVVSIPLVIWSGPVIWLSVISTLVLIFFTLYLIDLAFFTYYQLGEDGLYIHSQLRSFFFPYRSMKSIQQGSVFDLFTRGKQKRFALSAHCLTITFSKGDWKKISLSPHQSQRFLDFLLQQIDQERSKRASHNHLK